MSAGKKPELERFEAYLAAAQFVSQRWDGRRAIEWRMGLALWALLAAGLAKGVPEVPLIGAAAVILLHSFFLQSVWLRHGSDAALVWHHFNLARAEIGTANTDRESPQLRIGIRPQSRWLRERVGFLWDWSMSFQLGVTSLLVAALVSAADTVSLYGIRIAAG